MPAPRPTKCLVEHTVSDLSSAIETAGSMQDVADHARECLDCKRVAARLAQVAKAARGDERAETHEPTRPSAPSEIFANLSPSAPRYELGREIARGGMGRVFEAWDTKHDRRVAIKCLLGPGAKRERRFAREASITARLQHPAIVAVYDAGSLRSGEPFFAMKLVDGPPLSQLIADTPQLRARLALLPQLIAVCEAIAYAHEQRVIHRDLKPSNVLIGRFGEVVVIDWGLAKTLDPQGEEDADAHAPDVADGIGDALTAEGTRLGTPSFMAPEQASMGQVDARTDVYALGALLYFVFAGVPPYVGESSRDVVARVQSEPPTPVGKLAPTLPADLVAIIEKAMTRDPEGRYATADEMAKDLRRLEGGELVAAHSYSFVALLRRFLARHRAAVATAAVLVVALVLVGAVSVRRIVRERDKADAAQRLAEVERARAVTQRDAAEGVVEFMIGELRARLTPLGKLALLGGVGAKVSEYYRALTTAGNDGDLAAVRRHAAALDTLSFVEERRQSISEAVDLARQSVELWDRALALAPSDPRAMEDAAKALGTLGWRYHRASDSPRAWAAFERALALASECARLAPKNPSTLATLGYVRSRRGHTADEEDNEPAARTELEASVAAYAASAEQEPGNTDYQFNLSSAHFALAALVAHDDEEQSAREARACLDVVRSLRASAPDNREWQRREAWCQAHLGVAETAGGRPGAALVDLLASARTREALRKSDPENAEWQREYAMGSEKVCAALAQLDRLDEASRACAEAIAIDERLVARAPALVSAHEDLVMDLQSAAHVELQRGRDGRARELLARAIADYEGAAKAAPDDPSITDGLSELHKDAAVAELQLHRPARALEEARAAEALLAKSPHPDEMNRAELRRVLGDALSASGETAAAEATYRAAIELDVGLALRSPSRTPRLERARALRGLAEVLSRDPARGSETREAIVASIAILEGLRAEERLAPAEQRELARLQARLPRAHDDEVGSNAPRSEVR